MERNVYDPSLMENRYRHEFKYLCSLGELQVLKVRLAGIMQPDPHAGAKESQSCSGFISPRPL